MAHKLLTEAIKRRLPPLYSQEHTPDPIVRVKFFTPDSSWTWFATEYDPEERRFFGLVDGQEQEWGYFSLDELEEARGPLGLPIERDMYFGEKPMSEATTWRPREERGRRPRTPPANGMRTCECDYCGSTVMLPDGMTNRCQNCGEFYNGAGQQLAHPSQWGEETGESFDDFGNQTGFVDDEW